MKHRKQKAMKSNRDSFIDSYDLLVAYIEDLNEQLQDTVDEMEDAGTSQVIDEITYKIPAHVFDDTRQAAIESTITSLIVQSKNHLSEDTLDEFEETLNELSSVLSHFAEAYNDTIDDTDVVYDLIAEFDTWLDDFNQFEKELNK